MKLIGLCGAVVSVEGQKIHVENWQPCTLLLMLHPDFLSGLMEQSSALSSDTLLSLEGELFSWMAQVLV